MRAPGQTDTPADDAADEYEPPRRDEYGMTSPDTRYPATRAFAEHCFGVRVREPRF